MPTPAPPRPAPSWPAPSWPAPPWSAPPLAEALLTPAEMGRADALAAASGLPLMEAAGRAVARAVLRLYASCRVLVLCGPGSNGGDGLVAARLLAARGWPVAVATLPDGDRAGRSAAPGGAADPSEAGATPPPSPFRTEAARAAAAWRGPTVPFSPEEAARAELVVDAVFGAGLSRPVGELVARTLAAARRVVAVDVPSGLDGATGAPRGLVRAAELTVTFVRRKPGHLLLPGRDLCGPTLLADIGMPDAVLEAVPARIWLNGPGLWRLHPPGDADHKYTRGAVTVLGGSMPGAGLLAAAGARGGGAGIVTLAVPDAALAAPAAPHGLIVTDAPLAALLEDRRREVWVCGPGLGRERAGEALPALLAAGRTVVADADALTAFEHDPERLRGCAVLTPHAGEFARLFGPPGEDRPAAVRAAAARLGCVVLLKGADTVVAAPDGRLAVNGSAPPWLATAGAGDVLAGLVAALLAGGLPPWEAACAGAWLHGRAAHHAGPGLLAEDLPRHLPAALRDAWEAPVPPDRPAARPDVPPGPARHDLAPRDPAPRGPEPSGPQPPGPVRDGTTPSSPGPGPSGPASSGRDAPASPPPGPTPTSPAPFAPALGRPAATLDFRAPAAHLPP